MREALLEESSPIAQVRASLLSLFDPNNGARETKAVYRFSVGDDDETALRRKIWRLWSPRGGRRLDFACLETDDGMAFWSTIFEGFLPGCNMLILAVVLPSSGDLAGLRVSWFHQNEVNHHETMNPKEIACIALRIESIFSSDSTFPWGGTEADMARYFYLNYQTKHPLSN